jgi:hypothetical protein
MWILRWFGVRRLTQIMSARKDPGVNGVSRWQELRSVQ